MIGLLGVTIMEVMGVTLPHVFKDTAKDPRINAARMNLKVFISYPTGKSLIEGAQDVGCWGLFSGQFGGPAHYSGRGTPFHEMESRPSHKSHILNNFSDYLGKTLHNVSPRVRWFLFNAEVVEREKMEFNMQKSKPPGITPMSKNWGSGFFWHFRLPYFNFSYPPRSLRSLR